MYLSTSDELADFCEKARSCRVIAVDTEFLREKTYFPRLCLVQVRAGEDIAAIDPILIEDLSPLAALFEDPDIVKVFHACSQDLEVIYDGMGCLCNNVFDTQVAAAFLGMKQQVGYGPLVEHYCDVHLAKAEALTDWSRRPLDPEQLVYAEDDVRYLPGIYETMMAELVRADRLSWALPEIAEVSDPSRVRKDPQDAYLRLKRASQLSRRQLAVAREVCRWREDTASKRDVPRRWLASDEFIVELCRRTPTSLPRLRKIRGAEKLSERDARGIVAAVQAGLDCPVEKLPRSLSRRHATAEAESVVDLMNAVLRVASEKAGVAPQLVASKDDLLDLIEAPAESRLSSGWRFEVAGRALKSLLAGEVGLTVKEGRLELL